MAQTNKVFPIVLLLEGHPCLVVGGGKVATRKTELLLDSGAIVTLVSPEISPKLQELSQNNSFRWIKRCFEEKDLEGQHLVYAATDDPCVNKHILELCRSQRILCCAVDSGWREGDFLTPAILKKDGLVVSVSTSGRACRRSRLVKESLARHIDSISCADLIVIGTSHEQLNVTNRESLHLTGDRFLSTGRMLSQIWGLHEYMIVNTCNRVELHAVGVLDESRLQLLLRVFGFDKLEKGQYYVKHGMDAFKHSCLLCAGLLSQMPGEYHIVAQLKQSLEICANLGWAAGMIKEWMSAVLHVSKDIRQVIAPYLKNLEIEDVAVEYIVSQLQNVKKFKLCVLGTGKTGSGFIRKILSHFPEVEIHWCFHKNRPDLSELSIGQNIHIADMDKLNFILPAVDVLVSAMSSDNFIINSKHIPVLQKAGKMILIDLAMPRNIDPSLSKITSLQIVDLDGLKQWRRIEMADFEKLNKLCNDLILEHKEYYDKLITSFQGRNAEE